MGRQLMARCKPPYRGCGHGLSGVTTITFALTFTVIIVTFGVLAWFVWIEHD